MHLPVLGSGCASCKKLFELTQEAVTQLRLKEQVEYVTDVSKIIEMGVMSSPVLAIDGKPALAGFVPDIKKIKEVLTQGDEPCCCSDSKSACKCGGNC